MSGLSDAVVVAEASDHSGTLRTAAYAVDQGKQLYIVPGDITRPMSKGCNSLIDHGAHPYVDFDSFVYFGLRMRPKARRLRHLGADEKHIVDLIKQGITSGEQIASTLKIESYEFNQTITMLELKRVVEPLGYNNWGLV